MYKYIVGLAVTSNYYKPTPSAKTVKLKKKDEEVVPKILIKEKKKTYELNTTLSTMSHSSFCI